MMVKKFIAYVLSWSLYWFGDLISKIFINSDFFCKLYPIYNWCMIKSEDIQNWAGNKTPWE